MWNDISGNGGWNGYSATATGTDKQASQVEDDDLSRLEALKADNPYSDELWQTIYAVRMDEMLRSLSLSNDLATRREILETAEGMNRLGKEELATQDAATTPTSSRPSDRMPSGGAERAKQDAVFQSTPEESEMNRDLEERARQMHKEGRSRAYIDCELLGPRVGNWE